MVLSVAALMAAMMVASAGPALADSVKCRPNFKTCNHTNTYGENFDDGRLSGHFTGVSTPSGRTTVQTQGGSLVAQDPFSLKGAETTSCRDKSGCHGNF